jgi:hypothetical protein
MDFATYSADAVFGNGLDGAVMLSSFLRAPSASSATCNYFFDYSISPSISFLFLSFLSFFSCFSCFSFLSNLS